MCYNPLKRFISALFLIAVMAAMDASAQAASTCTLRGQDTVSATGVPYRKCLDLTGLAGKTVEIPSNVTRIDNDGFSLCESSEQEGGLADIIYIMDQSGSMMLRYVWISPNGLDTVLLENFNGCTNLNNNDANNQGNVTVLDNTGSRQVPRLNPNKTPAGCTGFAGDPYAQRAVAFKQAIDFQAARAPNSTAGYMGFALNVSDPMRPLKLNTVANVNLLKNNITPRYSDWTNYKAPLDSAKKWLLNPALSPNPSKAIIFLSDGRPTGADSANYINVLDPAYPTTPGIMPPIFGIFMGRPSPDTLKLSDLSKRTGGQFFLIPSNRPDSLKSVVERIQNIILRQFQPNSAQIFNATVAPPESASAGEDDFIRQSDGSWAMMLDKNVSLLKSVENGITLTSVHKDINFGTLRTAIAAFSLKTTGLAESINKNLPGTQFSVKCVELPPDPNVVKSAYIKDTDGDGGGDMVFFVFTRPLAALPVSIDTLYWNKVAASPKELLNAAPPKLSFLPGSGNTIVIADLTAAPYPVGLTSIPKGERPIAVLPKGLIFEGQRPPIADSMGPIITGAVIKPFDAGKLTQGGSLEPDTLVINVSEAMLTANDWDQVLLFSKPVGAKCTEYDKAMKVVPGRQPVHDKAAGTITILTATQGGAPAPVSGDCVYLRVDGTYTDTLFNFPPVRGVILKGAKPPREIELFRGYPPVAGLAADKPGFVLANNDDRNGGELDFSKPDEIGKYVTFWVPPVGFDPAVAFVPTIPKRVDQEAVGTDTKPASAMPGNIGAVQVVSTGKYIADVRIFDGQGNFVKFFRQPFGYQGELNNSNRIANRGMVSYLVWDLKDHRGQKAGQGVYVWKVVFQFEKGKQEIRYTKTGVMRRVPGP